jgi:outer membrane protein
MKAHSVGLFLLLLSVCAPALQGQQQESTRPWSLQQCIDAGLKRNLDVQRAQNQVETYSTYRTSAYGEFLPSVNASGSWVRSDQNQLRIRPDGLVESRDSWSYGINAGLTIFDGMRNFNSVDKSLLDYEASQQYATRTTQSVVYTIQEVYFNTLRLKELTRVQDANVERSNKQLELIRELNRVGSVPLADVYKQEVQVGSDRLAQLDAKNSYQNALADIQALLGLEPRMDFAIADAQSDTEISPADIAAWRTGLGDFASLVDEAAKARADYRERELSLQSAEKSISIARSGHYPVLSAFAQYNWSNLELKDFSVYDRFSYGLNLNVPLFAGFQVSTGVQRAEIAQREIGLQREHLRRTIATEILKAMNNLETAGVNVEIAATKLISAREDHRIASERYNLGSGTILDLITAAAGLRLAESDVINARFGYLTAQRGMEFQLGRTQY